MSTHALITIKDEGKPLVQIYSHFDGDECLRSYLEKRMTCKLINGHSTEKAPEHTNGIGDFAAQLIAELKNGAHYVNDGSMTKTFNPIGNIYIVNWVEADLDNEYHYIIEAIDGKLHLTCEGI